MGSKAASHGYWNGRARQRLCRTMRFRTSTIPRNCGLAAAHGQPHNVDDADRGVHISRESNNSFAVNSPLAHRVSTTKAQSRTKSRRYRRLGLGAVARAAVLGIIIAILPGLNQASPAGAQTLGGQCNAFSGATGLGSSYSDANISVPTCGPRPIDGGSQQAVYAYPGALSTPGYQCVEFSERYLYYKFGVTMPVATNGAQLVDRYAARYPSMFTTIRNGTPNSAPQIGDVLSFSNTPTFGGTGHTAVVSGSAVNGAGNGQIWVEEENADDNHGNNVMSVSSWSVRPEYGFAYVKWLHPAAPSNNPHDVRQFYVLNGAWATFDLSAATGVTVASDLSQGSYGVIG
ncbi:MAG: hypothetical protein QOF30_1114 [Acidimicrobiaceae bacterium]|nr:hypothetical protein [Acidimicrobiaceae bacterium]